MHTTAMKMPTSVRRQEGSHDIGNLCRKVCMKYTISFRTPLGTDNNNDDHLRDRVFSSLHSHYLFPFTKNAYVVPTCRPDRLSGVVVTVWGRERRYIRMTVNCMSPRLFTPVIRRRSTGSYALHIVRAAMVVIPEDGDMPGTNGMKDTSRNVVGIV